MLRTAYNSWTVLVKERTVFLILSMKIKVENVGKTEIYTKGLKLIH